MEVNYWYADCFISTISHWGMMKIVVLKKVVYYKRYYNFNLYKYYFTMYLKHYLGIFRTPPSLTCMWHHLKSALLHIALGIHTVIIIIFFIYLLFLFKLNCYCLQVYTKDDWHIDWSWPFKWRTEIDC